MSRFKLERALRATTLGLGIALATIATAVPFTVRAATRTISQGTAEYFLLGGVINKLQSGSKLTDEEMAYKKALETYMADEGLSLSDLSIRGGKIYIKNTQILTAASVTINADLETEAVTINPTYVIENQRIDIPGYGYILVGPNGRVLYLNQGVNLGDPSLIDELAKLGFYINNGQVEFNNQPVQTIVFNNGGGTFNPNPGNGGNITINGGSGFPNNNNGGQMVINGGGGNSIPNNGGNIILSGGGNPNQSVFTSGVNQAGGPHMVIGYQLTGVKDMPQFFLGDADEVKDEFILNKGEMKKFSDGGITYAIANVKTSNGIFGAFDWDKWVLLVEKDGKYYLPRQHSELEVPPMLTFLEKRLKADKSDASAKTFLSELHKRKIWGVMPWVKDSADTADNFWAVRNSKAMVDREAAKKALDVGINYQNIQEYHFANGNPQVLISSANSGQMVYGPGSSMMNPSQSTVNLQQIFGNIPGYSFQNGQLVQINNPMTMGGYSGSIQVSGSPASSSSILQSWLPKPEVVDMGSVQKLRVGRVEKDEIVFDYYIVRDNVAYDKDGNAVYQLENNGIWAVVKGGESKVQVAAEKAEKAPAKIEPTAEASLNLVAKFSDGHAESTTVAEGTDSEIREIHDEAERRIEGIATDLRIKKAPTQAAK